MKFKLLFAIVPLLILHSCSKKECDEALTKSEFKVGITYCLSDNQSITIDSISDYRCPSNVECIWAGETKLFMSMFDEDVTYDFEITVPNDSNPFIVADKFGYKYTIEKINPYPLSPVEVTQDDYRVKMSIEKVQ